MVKKEREKEKEKRQKDIKRERERERVTERKSAKDENANTECGKWLKRNKGFDQKDNRKEKNKVSLNQNDECAIVTTSSPTFSSF